ncbi:MAG TPA: hypothetical protein VK050_08555 [Flavobacteriaceae bacterium]|nr:hypothetical protein [Flavobacteriaceae bacterium]
MKQCNYTSDGYCLRPENDYCPSDQCLGNTNCQHKIQGIQVIATCVNCETTQVVCTDCGAELEKPKTDCT